MEGRPKCSTALRLKMSKTSPSELPDVAWDLLPMDNYRAFSWMCLRDFSERTQVRLPLHQPRLSLQVQFLRDTRHLRGAQDPLLES